LVPGQKEAKARAIEGAKAMTAAVLIVRAY
jgi:hypothetical protein